MKLFDIDQKYFFVNFKIFFVDLIWVYLAINNLKSGIKKMFFSQLKLLSVSLTTLLACFVKLKNVTLMSLPLCSKVSISFFTNSRVKKYF